MSARYPAPSGGLFASGGYYGRGMADQAVPPEQAADLDSIDRALAASVTAAQQASTASSHLRTLLAGGPPPPPPPAPVTILKASAAKKDSSNITVSFSLGGTLANVDNVGGAIQGVPTSWIAKPFTTTVPDNTVDLPVTVNSSGTYYFQVHDIKKTANNGWTPAPIPYSVKGDPPPPPPPGQGRFTFGPDSNGNMSFIRDGKPWIPLGVNMPGPNGYWGGGFTPVGKTDHLAKDWGWNFIRLFEQKASGGECQYCPSAHNPWSIDDVVREYTSAGYVVMIDWHQYGFGSMITPAQTAEMVTVWTAWANQYKDNSLVWFELRNEPESSYATGNKDDNACFDRWLNGQIPVVKAIRDTGATNIIIVNDAQSGLGANDFWSMGPSSGSAIINRGAQLLASDPTGNMAWDVHTYDAWGWLAVNEQNNDCSQRYTNDQRDARLTDYVKRVWQATGRPIFSGEFGWQVGESTTSGSGFHYPYTTCGSRTMAAQQAFTRAGKALGMGGTQWPGFQLCTNGNDAYDVNSLTPCGKDWYDYCQVMSSRNKATLVNIDPNLQRLHTFQMAQPQRKTEIA